MTFGTTCLENHIKETFCIDLVVNKEMNAQESVLALDVFHVGADSLMSSLVQLCKTK